MNIIYEKRSDFTKLKIVISDDGTRTEEVIAWDANDYEVEMQAIDAQITTRRIEEAVRGVTGAVEWLQARADEKQALRDAMPDKI